MDSIGNLFTVEGIHSVFLDPVGSEKCVKAFFVLSPRNDSCCCLHTCL